MARTGWLALTLVLGLLAGGVVGARSAPAAFSGGNGQIAFVSDRDKHFPGGTVYVVRADGSRRVDLGGDAGPDNAHPTWTRDGSAVVYAATKGLVVARADGRGRGEIPTPTEDSNGPYLPSTSRRGEVAFNGAWVARLADGSVRALHTGQGFVWSPDGRRLAFTRSTGAGRQLIGVVNRDGTNRRWLTWCERCGIANDDEAISWSPDGRKILFTLGRYGPNGSRGHDIYVVDVATKRLRRLRRTNGTQERDPVWSPDGRRIAFLGGRHKRQSIYVMRADGSGIRRVARMGEHYHGLLSWSPRGDRLAYLGVGVEVIDLAGRRVARITSPRCWESVYSFAWSPRGERIAFSAHRGDQNDTDLFVGELDDRSPRRLTDNCLDEHQPAWSPDGSTIAYVRTTRTGAGDIHLMAHDGTGHRAVTRGALSENSPAWSPDGDELLFSRSALRAGDAEIFKLSLSGGRLSQLTNTPGSNGSPQWSSRNEIVFTSTRDGPNRRQIYVMNADGSGQRRVTDGTFDAFDPAWSPDGTAVVFAGRTGLTQELWIVPAAGGPMKRLTTLGNYIPASDPAWSPDSQWIVFSADFDGGKDSRHALAVVPATGGAVRWLPYEPIDNLMPDWQPAPPA
jgi:Tol biopolymer transport system component